MYRFTSVEQLENGASELMQEKGFQFSDFCTLFSGFNHGEACQLFNNILSDILEQAEKNGKPAYSEQTHLVAEGDFHLSLKMSGEGDRQRDTTLCVSDFDMILINLSSQTVSLPLYRTAIDPACPEKRPNPLQQPCSMDIVPYHPYLFEAFSDTADIDFASMIAPVLVVHSKPRAPVTWVFDRTTLDPLYLTDNDLQRSRIQLAIRVIGDTGSVRQIATLKQLASSDINHVIRWEAAESVYKLDEQEGIELLQHQLTHDAHPSIAKAARQTLHNLTEEVAP